MFKHSTQTPKREHHVMQVPIISITYHSGLNKIIGLGSDNRLYWGATGLRKTNWKLIRKGQKLA